MLYEDDETYAMSTVNPMSKEKLRMSDVTVLMLLKENFPMDDLFSGEIGDLRLCAGVVFIANIYVFVVHSP
jgi:hypothetical protein